MFSSGLAFVMQNFPAPQSTSARQATHLCVVVISQIGVGFMQSAFIKQPTQAFLVTSVLSTKHLGVDMLVQSMLTRHSVQRLLVTVSHSGFDVPHCALAVHSTHLFLVASRLVKHLENGATHAIVFTAVQATHLLIPRSHAGVAGVPKQFPSARHCTHWFIAEFAFTLHCAFGAVQPKPAKHGTH